VSLSTIANDILKYAPGLNSDLVKSIIQTSYEELCVRDWSQLKLTRQIYTAGFYSTGTVSVNASGEVTGVGTAFTSGMVGRFMKVSYGDSFFEIASFTDPLHATLKDWPGGVIAAGTAYSIFKTIYKVDVEFGIVFNLIYQINLIKRSQTYFNKIDPARTSSGSSPIFWAYAGSAEDGSIQVELYPPVTQVVPVRVQGKRRALPLEDGDIPKLPENLIQAASLIDCFEMKDQQQPNQGWDKRQIKQVALFTALLQQYEEEDFQLDSHHDRVKDVSEDPIIPSDDNFALSHDVG